MFGTNLLCCCSLVVVLFAAVVKVNSSRLSSGKEAEKLCQAYKKVCPRGKVCAIQTLKWPRVMKFPVCVHKNYVKARSEVCEQAPAPGGCSAQFRRWYYNVHMAACSWFTYGGCGGNDNNFRSREECERICVTGLQDNGQVTRGTTDVYRRRDEQLYPRHPHHQNPRPSPGRSNGRSNWHRTTATATTSHYYNRRHHHRDANRHRGMNTDSNLGAMDNSRFDAYGRPYVYTTPGPTTQSVWSGNADDNRSNRTPLEHRVAPVEHRAIHAARGRPAAFHARPLSLAAVSRAPDSHANNNRRLTDLPESGRGLTDVPEKNRRLTDLPDSSRGLNTNERLAGLAVQMPRLPTVNIRRRVSGFGRRAHPSRPLSLSARPALLARAPLHASAATDVTPGLTSPLEASYAADANETIRKFPTRPPRQRKRGRGQKRRNRRRRRKNRKRGRKNLRRKPKKQHTTSGGSFTIYDNDNDTRNTNSTRDQALRDLSSQFEEFRQKKATFWPEKTQNDAAEFLVDSKSFQERIQREGKKSRRRRRRRRRRKGHGKKRRQRGRKRERNQSQVESTAAKAFQGSNQYYEKIHLFGVLDSGHNATDPMT